MLGLCWLTTMAALLAAVDEPDAAEWVRRLGSDRFAGRVEAARALEKLGPSALPALRAAADSPDPRIRARAASLRETLERRTETDRVTLPTLVRLDFRDRPLGEVIDAMNARHGFGLALRLAPAFPGMIGRPPALKAKEDEMRARRVTVVADRELPFWEALDRLRAAGRVTPALDPRSPFGLSSASFVLLDDPGGPSLTSDSGPFRVRLTGLHATFEHDFVGTPSPAEGTPRALTRPRAGPELIVRMSVVPEPGRLVRQVGPTTIVEAVDDRGRSLLPDGGRNDPLYPQPPTLNGSSGFPLSASLGVPDPAARAIRRLRGTLPVVAVAYASDPIVIPLDGAIGGAVRRDDLTIAVVAVERGEGQVTVEVEVAPDRPPNLRPEPYNPTRPPDFTKFRADQLLNRLELRDAGGRQLALSWTQGRGRNPMTGQHRVRLTPNVVFEDQPPDAAGRLRPPIARRPVPVELRFHGFVQATLTVSFDFRDVPLP